MRRDLKDEYASLAQKVAGQTKVRIPLLGLQIIRSAAGKDVGLPSIYRHARGDGLGLYLF